MARADAHGIIVGCRECGKANRLPFEALSRSTRCGSCRKPLAAPSDPVEIPTAADFDALVGRSSLPVLIDFWAAWCGPCRMVAPEIVKVAAREQGRFIVAKVDTEAIPKLATRLGVRSIPTLAVFKGGREVGRTAGAMTAERIAAFASEAAGNLP